MKTSEKLNIHTLLPWVLDTLSLFWEFFTYKHTELPSRIFHEYVSFQRFWQLFKRSDVCHRNLWKRYRPRVRMFIQHPEPLRYLPTRLKFNQILLRLWYLLGLHTTVYAIIDIMQHIVRSLSANKGNVNNDYHQISPKPLQLVLPRIQR